MLFDTEQPRSSGAHNLKMWNPTDTLGIINPDPSYNRITCIGYAPSKGRRCRNPINAGNRAFIMSTLDEISYLSPDDPTVKSLLRSIAGSALCVRYHQNQEQSVLGKWQQSINQLKSEANKRACAPTVSSRYPVSKGSKTLSDLEAQLQEMRDMIASLTEQLNEEQTRNRAFDRESTSQTRSRQEEELRRSAQRQREQEARKKEDDRRKRQQEEEEQRKRAEEERRERMEEERRRKQEEEEREQRRKDMEDEARRRKERQQREKADTEQANERMRQKAQKVRDERRQAEAARQKQEREEWDEAWECYQERWAAFRLAACREGDIRDSIPWPVKSGRHSDVETSTVKEFMELATPRDAEMVKLMRKECQKWHPDKVSVWLQGCELSVDDRELIDTICRVVTDLLNSKAGKSSEFL